MHLELAKVKMSTDTLQTRQETEQDRIAITLYVKGGISQTLNETETQWILVLIDPATLSKITPSQLVTWHNSQL